MSDAEYLWQVVESKEGTKHLERIEIPPFITENIKFPLFDWQKRALQYFLAYENPDNGLTKGAPTHLLFNMATGTGKTLLMAALILYYYQKGYRHFIFFVNQNNIVEKTEENLLNPSHRKYLFNPNIIIDDKTIRIKKVEMFSDTTDDIQIFFTSIQKLHNAVYTVKENCVYLQDLQKRDIVMLGDEAHHLNADTKKKKGEQEELDLPTEIKERASEAILEKSWENTVINRILQRERGNKHAAKKENKNALLEFTATVPKNKEVEEKYKSKTIFSFDLKDFLKAGYTKEINLVSSSFDKKRRILQALLLNWYRNKMALHYNIGDFKPVILFRSKQIENSEKDIKEFKELIGGLSEKDFEFLKGIKAEKANEGAEIYQKGKSRIVDIKHFIDEEKIKWSEIIGYMKDTFAERNCIITNSKDKSAKGASRGEKTTEQMDKLLNSLEDRNNHITAIFTVKRLTEGWDVLNLFDIVRLYEGHNEGGSSKKTAKATVEDVQLIGRGVRYFPFAFNGKPVLRRKFDNSLDHELRVLEEFYYHSDDEPRYISELKKELKNKGFIDDKKKIKKFALKKDFVDSDFYKEVRLWLNEQKQNPNRKKLDLSEIKKDFAFTETIKPDSIEETRVEMGKEEDTERFKTKKEDSQTFSLKLKDFVKQHRHIIRKAINMKAKNDNSVLRFENLKNELKIERVGEILEEKFLGDFPINIVVPSSYNSINDISNSDILKILLRFFEVFECKLKEVSNPHIGSEFLAAKFSSVFEGVKEKMVEADEDSKILEIELIAEPWYVLDAFNGTGEEERLIEFIKETIGNLKNKYDQVFLLRNEEVYTIYDFDKGRGFQPDFLLFLKWKQRNLYYQVFIEPKGSQFKDAMGRFEAGKEGWKEAFLEQISKKYCGEDLLKIEDQKYKLIGLPLYNEEKKEEFREAFSSYLI